MFTRLDKLWRKHSSTFTEVPAYRSLVSGAQSVRGIKHDDEDFIERCKHDYSGDVISAAGGYGRVEQEANG